MVLARTPVFLSVLINSSTLCHADIISKQRQREAGIGLSSKTWGLSPTVGLYDGVIQNLARKTEATIRFQTKGLMIELWELSKESVYQLTHSWSWA